MTRFHYWFRWKYRFIRCVWLGYRGKCQSYAEARELVNDRFPMTFHEYVYEQMAKNRGRTPSLFDPPPNADDVDSFMTEWAEYGFRGMSGQEILDECGNLERERHEKMAAIIEHAGPQAREKHDVA